MLNAFLFPGQGSQVIGMGKELYNTYPTVKDIFVRVSEEIKQDITKIMFDGHENLLIQTENTQVAIMLVSYSLIHIMENEFKFFPKQKVNYMAGHSLGQYTALCVAGTFDVYTCAKLLKIRGLAMQQAVPENTSGMAAIIGITDLKIIQEILDRVCKSGEICTIANDNSIGQVVISGHLQPVERAMQVAKEKGAKLVVKLSVSGAFHSSLMTSAVNIMEKALSEIKLVAPQVSIIDNTTAEIIDKDTSLKPLLLNQLTQTVRWRESMLYLISKGVNIFIEVGCNTVLTGLLKRINTQSTRINIQNIQDIENFVRTLEK